MVTLPLVTFRMLNPTVGIMSSEKPPVAMMLTSVVFPEFCKPTSVSSISCLKNKLLSQFNICSTSDANMEDMPARRLRGAAQRAQARRSRGGAVIPAAQRSSAKSTARARSAR